jgi:hypothetical protein
MFSAVKDLHRRTVSWKFQRDEQREMFQTLLIREGLLCYDVPAALGGTKEYY